MRLPVRPLDPTADYWAERTKEFEAAKRIRRRKLVFASLPIPALRGQLRVVVAPRNGGYHWFVSDSRQLSQPWDCPRLAQGWHPFYGKALAAGEAAALVGS